MTQPLHYLASPYSHFPRGLDQAYMEAVQLTFRLRAKKHRIYCPIAASHMLAKQTGVDPRDHTFWMACCGPWIARADALLIARMDGWRDSLGIRIEIEAFRQAKKPVRYLDCETLEIREGL